MLLVGHWVDTGGVDQPGVEAAGGRTKDRAERRHAMRIPLLGYPSASLGDGYIPVSGPICYAWSTLLLFCLHFP